MATKKTKKTAVVKFPDTVFVARDQWVDTGDFFYNVSVSINDCAESGNTVRVGVYQLVGYKDVSKVTEIKVEDVNG